MAYQFTDNTSATVTGSWATGGGFIRIHNVSGEPFPLNLTVQNPQIITVTNDNGLEVMALTNIVPTTGQSGSFDCTVLNAQHDTTSIPVTDGSAVYAGITAKMMEEIFSSVLASQNNAANISTNASNIAANATAIGLVSGSGFGLVPSKQLLLTPAAISGTWNVDVDGPLIAKIDLSPGGFLSSATINIDMANVPTVPITVQNKMILMVGDANAGAVSLTFNVGPSIAPATGLLYTDSHLSDFFYGGVGSASKTLSLQNQVLFFDVVVTSTPKEIGSGADTTVMLTKTGQHATSVTS